jgi:tRNA pseudouridine55 synthase
MDGLLVVNKPAGPTSHDVVARVRRVLRERRIGHTGTLDPTATGVLPLVIGRATRLARFLSGSDKVYEATVRLGFATDSGDAAGAPIGTPFQGALPTREAIDQALEPFRGTFLQQPPAYSAKKIGGTRSYALARQAARDKAGRAGRVDKAGKTAAGNEEPTDELASLDPSVPPAPPALPAPVQVTAHAIDILDCAADTVTIRVRCTAGFYIRSLAHDLGERLGVGAHLVALCRTSAGSFALDQAVTLSALEGDGGNAVATQALVTLEQMLPAFPACVLNPDGVRHAAQGRDLSAIDFVDDRIAGDPAAGVGSRAAHVRLVGPDGALVAVAIPSSRPGVLHPAIVLV